MPSGYNVLQKFNLHVNTLFYPRNTGFITNMVMTIELEFINRPPFWEMHVDGLMICLFSLMARETVRNGKSNDIPRKDASEFDRLRLEMYNDPSFSWNINTMAARLQLSRSRFTVLYRQLYDISPMEDLITARIDRSKYLLSTSGMSVSCVSDEAGYNSVEHFTRQFKARTGYSPLEFRGMGRF